MAELQFGTEHQWLGPHRWKLREKILVYLEKWLNLNLAKGWVQNEWMHYGRAFSSRPLLCGSSQCNVRLKGWTIPNLIFLNVFKKGEFLFLNECNTVGHFPAHLPLLCGSSQCFPPQETSTYVSRKDSSLDTSGDMGWKHFLVELKETHLALWAKKRRRRRNKAAKSCLPPSHLSLH